MANRSHGKIDRLRPEVKSEVESMITSNNFTYREIVDYIRDSTGEMISQASVCRYARRLCESLDSIRFAQETFRAINDEINRTPDMDTTEGIMRIVSHLLLTNIQRLSDEDFEDVDPLKLLKQASDLIRVSAYKRGVDIKNKELTEMGFDAIKQKAFVGVSKKYPDLYEKFSKALDELASEEGGGSS